MTKSVQKETRRRKAIDRDGAACCYCRAPLTQGAEAVLQRVRPVCRGGSNELDNLRVACRTCADRRGDGVAAWDDGHSTWVAALPVLPPRLLWLTTTPGPAVKATEAA